MKYSVIKIVNGNTSIHAENLSDLNAAKVNFHGLCQTLANAPDVETAYVKVINDNLEFVGLNEFIEHLAQTPGE